MGDSPPPTSQESERRRQRVRRRGANRTQRHEHTLSPEVGAHRVQRRRAAERLRKRRHERQQRGSNRLLGSSHPAHRGHREPRGRRGRPARLPPSRPRPARPERRDGPRRGGRARPRPNLAAAFRRHGAQAHSPDAPEPSDGSVHLPTHRKARIDRFDLDAQVCVKSTSASASRPSFATSWRPPLALDRLKRLRPDLVALELKRSWSAGTTDVSMSVRTFLTRLAALVPRPRTNTTLYYGVLAPHAKHRRRHRPHSTRPIPRPRRLLGRPHAARLRPRRPVLPAVPRPHALHPRRLRPRRGPTPPRPPPMLQRPAPRLPRPRSARRARHPRLPLTDVTECARRNALLRPEPDTGPATAPPWRTDLPGLSPASRCADP